METWASYGETLETNLQNLSEQRTTGGEYTYQNLSKKSVRSNWKTKLSTDGHSTGLQSTKPSLLDSRTGSVPVAVSTMRCTVCGNP